MNEEYVKVKVTIEAIIPAVFLENMFEQVRSAAPIDGHLVFEVSGR